jgi:hypothetical protein
VFSLHLGFIGGILLKLLIPQSSHIHTTHDVILIVNNNNNNNNNKGTSLWEQSTFSAFSQLQLNGFPWKFIFCTFFSHTLAVVCHRLLSVKNEGHLIWRSKYRFCCITEHTQTHTHRSRGGATPHTNHNTHTHATYTTNFTPHARKLRRWHITTQTHAWKPSMCLKQYHTHTLLTPHHTDHTTHIYAYMEAEEVLHHIPHTHTHTQECLEAA